MLQKISIEILMILFFGSLFSGCQKDDEKEVKLPAVITSGVTRSFDNSLEQYIYTGNGYISDYGGSKEISAGLCYSSTSRLPDMSDNVVTATPQSGRFSIRLPLEFGQKMYWIRAFALNKAGIAYGDTISYTTDCLAAPDVEAHYGMLFYLISPSDGDAGLLSKVLLSWNAQENRLFDVYLDINPNPSKVIASNLETREFEVSGLDDGTTYYWKIVMRIPKIPCAVFSSKVYRFSTAM